MNKFLPFFLMFLISWASCNKIIEVDLPEIDIKPVVNCMFQEGKPFTVNLSLPMENLDTGSFKYINDATVEISSQSQTVVALAYTGKGNYTTDILIPQKGVEYILKINIPGYEEITAKDIIPIASTKVVAVELKSGIRNEPVTGLGDKDKVPVHNIWVDIKYDKTIRNYMGFSIIYSIHEQDYNPNAGIYENVSGYRVGYLNSNDPSILNENLEQFDNHELLLFKDVLFKVQPEKVRFDLTKSNGSGIWLQYYQLSQEAFKYSKSYIIHNYTKDYDFWEIYEPLPLYSNIKNGYGIFAGYSMHSIEVFPDSIIPLHQ